MRIASIILSALTCLLFYQCDESLPPRSDPLQYIGGSFQSLPGPVTIRGGLPQSGSGGFRLEVKNLHDEVLQGEARVQAVVDVWMKDHPERHTQAIFTGKDIVNGTPFPGFVTIGVDSSIIIQGQWNHLTADDTPFWQFVNLTPEITNSGVPFCRSDSVHLMAQATLQIFKNVQPMKLRLEFALVYEVFGITCLPE